MKKYTHNHFWKTPFGKFKYFVRKIFFKQKCIAFETKNKTRIEKIFSINLDRKTQRWKQLLNELSLVVDASSIPISEMNIRFPAIDAVLINQKTNKKQLTTNYTLADQLFVEPENLLLHADFKKNEIIQMSRQEEAVALSHIAVWAKIASGNDEYTLVLEDDVFFDNCFSKILNSAWEELTANDSPLKTFDLLYLSYVEAKNNAPKLLITDHLFAPLSGMWHLSGYVLSKTGANKLLELLPVKGPVDLWMNHQFQKLKVYATARSIISQNDSLGSDNSYSALPVLLRLGALTFDTGSTFCPEKLPKPVFVMGENGLVQSSIATALLMLGYRTCFGVNVLPRAEAEKLFGKNKHTIFDAYVGIVELEIRVEELTELYPNSKFIFTGTRQVDTLRALGTNALFLETIENCNWEKICEFLDCLPPASNFPILIDTIECRTLAPSKSNPQRFPRKRTLKHDVSPWIVSSHKKWSGLTFENTDNSFFIERKYTITANKFYDFTEKEWELLEDTFPSNMALFRHNNFLQTQSDQASIVLKKENSYAREYTSASIKSNKSFLYGRFETVLKPARGAGLVTGFFLQRNSPRQEIDIEILGNNTHQMVANVYYNPGVEGSNFDYGNRGTPVLIDLGFDAADNFHSYVIEWTPIAIRWFVDGRLVYERVNWSPTPIPHLPMNCFINLWYCRSKEFAGPLSDRSLPATSTIRSVCIEGGTPRNERKNLS
ncbi:MAG: hypothetical protein COA84_10985 [Robiginitomaculum sp.]|nr:MAG: hypothetical protein COA84_10985 [Robiginitomaculum sp.]